MTGTWPADVEEGIKDIKGTKGPETENNINKNAKNPGGGDGNQLAYSLQTGLTKFAPMQKQPGTKITQKKATPLYPTSPYKIAKSNLPTPSQVTTVTASMTYSVQSLENPVRTFTKILFVFWSITNLGHRRRPNQDPVIEPCRSS